MKKILALIITTMLVVLTFGACTGSNTENVSSAGKTDTSDKKIKIVTTIFPEYDWVREILGDKAESAELTLLLDNGVDLHSYQPTAEDIMKIATCDLFIYVGGESDGWVEDALKEATNKDMKVIDLLDVLGDSVKEEEEKEYDEHVWLSLKNTVKLYDKITEEISSIDKDNAEAYNANNKAYIEKLQKLDEDYKTAVDGAKLKTVIFGDRFPFRYLVDDYGLDYYAAFVGCSAETEASFETIIFLAGKVDETGVKTILTIENSDKKIAGTIKGNTKNKDQDIAELNSLQSVTGEQADQGVTYYGVMKDNLDVLKAALN